MNTKEKILETLSDSTIAKALAKKYIEAEAELLEELLKLENYGEMCNCDCEEVINIIFEGECLEVNTYCLNCGGDVNNEN